MIIIQFSILNKLTKKSSTLYIYIAWLSYKLLKESVDLASKRASETRS